MFGDDKYFEDKAEELLLTFDFLDILEMNDLTDQDVLEILIRNGYVTNPERFFTED